MRGRSPRLSGAELATLDQVTGARGAWSVPGRPAGRPVPGAGELADGVQQAAGSARTTATDAVAAIRQLAVLVAVAIALIPMPLLLGAYLPLRRHWARSLRTGHWS